MEEIELVVGSKEKTIRIGTRLDDILRTRLLRDYSNVFAWSPEDMPDINQSVTVHKLNVDPAHKPARQKKAIFCSSETSLN